MKKVIEAHCSTIFYDEGDLPRLEDNILKAMKKAFNMGKKSKI